MVIFVSSVFGKQTKLMVKMEKTLSLSALMLISVMSVLIVPAFGTIPNYLHVCHRNDPKLNTCVVESVNNLKPQLKNGIPELGVPGMEPLRLDDIELIRGQGNLRTRLTLKKVDIFGASDFQLNRVKVDMSNMIFRIGVKFPLLKFAGDFFVDTKILSIPLKGNGNFEANATDCEAVAILKGTTVEDKGIEKMNFTELSIKLRIDDYHIELRNLFKDDTELNKAVNDWINQDKQRLIEISTPFIETKAQEVLLGIANDIVKNFAYDELFPM